MNALSAIHPAQVGGVPPKTPATPVDHETLLKVAKDFETAFLSEMLQHAGVGKMSDQFNGGAGEAGFSGFLVQEYAAEIARTGRFGVADKVYTALSARAGV